MSRRWAAVPLFVACLMAPAMAEEDASLVVAAAQADWARVESLVSGGIDPNETRSGGVTALMLACQQGRADIADLLVGAGADVNAVTEEGVTAVYLASQGGYPELVEKLVEQGAEINCPTSTGGTPLLVATAAGHKDIVITLVAHGSDVNCRLSNWKTALHIAEENGREDIAFLLRTNGAEKYEPGAMERLPPEDSRHATVVFRHSTFVSYFDLRTDFGWVSGYLCRTGDLEVVGDTWTRTAAVGELKCEGEGTLLPTELYRGVPLDGEARMYAGHFRLGNIEIEGCVSQSEHGIIFKDDTRMTFRLP